MQGCSESPSTGADAGVDPDERFALSDPLRVRQVLQSLIDGRALISAHVPGRSHAFPTAIIELGTEGDWLLLDGSAQGAINRSLREAPHLSCAGQIDRVGVRFRLCGQRQIEVDGRVAFRTPLPDAVVYLQRRELFRLETPAADPPSCLIRCRQDEGAVLEAEYRVSDISVGGIAITVLEEAIEFELRQRHRDCELRLPGMAPTAIQVEVRSVSMQTQANGAAVRRIGMAFTTLPRGADVAIQRYILQVERQRIARRNGLL
ncbi:flagellar brake protein [Luteimonas sp. RD2P54]|uniref:Flagellar brake protein YcgR n=1 Tax=Luteimonas endophytica TaxID=3042023 RepID=A0ABT6J3M1_9GAMM|nr:flagellar brake protein [Luteimonas endophytica]MDH5821416.1 flagellar brake protein [Luteimonas endophytica]